jgi:hypothetical protein
LRQYSRWLNPSFVLGFSAAAKEVKRAVDRDVRIDPAISSGYVGCAYAISLNKMAIPGRYWCGRGQPEVAILAFVEKFGGEQLRAEID